MPTPQLQNGYLSRLEPQSLFPRAFLEVLCCVITREDVSPYACVSSDATTPRADCRVAPAVRVKDGECVGRPWIAGHGHQHTAAARKRFENPPVMRLETDAARRGSHTVTG